MKYDVIVIGGGFSGVAAAIAAARNGAKTLIVEKAGALGGAAVNCLVNPFMRYWINNVDENGDKQREDINCGLFSEICDRLEKFGAISPERTCFGDEYLKIVLDDMCEEYGVDVLLHTTLTNVQVDGGHLGEASLFCCGKSFTASADVYIDCSGDANLSTIAGCRCEVGREEDNLCQPMTLCFRLINVDIEKFKENRQLMQQLYRELRESGEIKNPRENVLVFDMPGSGVLHFNTTRIVGKCPVDAWQLSEAEREARRQIIELHSFLKDKVPGFERSELMVSAAEIGVRESRMVVGEYTICEDDILGCRHFEDSVARGNYCIDIHSPDGSGTTIKKVPEGCYYTIPYRALIPKDAKNLLVAGRCISSTHVAQSAYRVMPICCSIGEGAGIAASLAVSGASEDVRAVDIRELQSILAKCGAKF